MDQISSLLVVKALDGLSMRAATIANNIANASSPGYRAMRVSFEDQLQQAARGGEVAVRGVAPQISSAPAGSADAEVRLDLEMASASQTALRYAALIDVLSRQMQIARAAVQEGR